MDENEWTWRRLKSETRLAVDDVCASGIGIRRLQLLLLPSFDNPMAFEIRQAESEWRLFSSQVCETYPVPRLLGYEHVPFESEKLAAYFHKVVSLSLPLTPYLNDGCGLDGTSFHIGVFGDMHSEWRFVWWSNSPPQWQPLVDLANEMLSAFAAALNATA
jgi:hypothetical protein